MENLDFRKKDIIINLLSVISLIFIIISIGLALNNPGSEDIAVNFASFFTGVFLSFYFYRGVLLYTVLSVIGGIILANILLKSFIASLSPDLIYVS